MRCPVCENELWIEHFKKLQKCKICGFVRADKKYFLKEPREIYTQEYYNGADYANYELEKDTLKSNFKNRMSLIKKFKTHGNLLEIGCAYGYFLDLASRSFKSSGVEVNKKVAMKAVKRGHRVTYGDFLKKRLTRNYYDVIVMLDVIEHLHCPDAYIKKCNDLLKKGGILVIETGDIESLLPRVQKGKWRLITPPIHLQYFSNKTLTNILEKNKFNIKYKKYVSFHRSIMQTFFRLAKLNSLKKMSTLSKLSFAVNTRDLLFIIAEK